MCKCRILIEADLDGYMLDNMMLEEIAVALVGIKFLRSQSRNCHAAQEHRHCADNAQPLLRKFHVKTSRYLFFIHFRQLMHAETMLANTSPRMDVRSLARLPFVRYEIRTNGTSPSQLARRQDKRY